MPTPETALAGVGEREFVSEIRSVAERPELIMESNIYAAPKAQLAMPVDEDVNRLYVVSLPKYFLLFIGTLGLYAVYWHYKNWARLRDLHQEDSWPVARAIFSIFFIHALFRRIDEKLKQAGHDYVWALEGIATITVLTMIVNGITERLASKGIASPITDVLSITSTFLLAYLLSFAQRAINVAAGDAKGDSNSNFTVANIAWLVFGGLIWLLVIIGYTAT